MSKRFIFVEKENDYQKYRGERISGKDTHWGYRGELSGTDISYTEGQLLVLNGLSQTNKRRITGMKEGSDIPVYKMSRSHYLFIRRQTKQEINDDIRESELSKELQEVRTAIRAMVPVTLFQQEAKLVRDLKSLRTSMNKTLEED